MIEWIQNWDEMRFYYWSGLSWLVLLPVYVGGLIGLAILEYMLRKVWKHAWVVVIPLLPILAIWPWWEELNIAWNFGQLCKKDAGIFVYKTVEVDGFYDDTHGWRADKLRDSGYRWVEGQGTESLWRHERVGEEIRSFKIDHATARYHYRTLASHNPAAHQIDQFEDVVMDTETNQVIGRYMNYYRGAPWFYIGLDRPTIPCRETERDTGNYGTLMIYALVLRNEVETIDAGEKN